MINIKKLQNVYKSNAVGTKQIQRNTNTFPFHSKNHLLNKIITPCAYEASNAKVDTNSSNIHTYHIKPKFVSANKYLFVANKTSVSFSKETTT